MQQIKVITAEEIDRSDMQAIFEEEVNGALFAGVGRLAEWLDLREEVGA